MYLGKDVSFVMGDFCPPDHPSDFALSSLGYLRNDISDIKKYYISLGFHLHEFDKMQYFSDFGYSDLYSFCSVNLGLDKSAVNRAVNVWKNFCRVQDYCKTMFLDPKYEMYSYSQLCEMLPLSDAERKKILPDMTIKDIREFKKNRRKPSDSVSSSSVATSQSSNTLDSYDLLNLHGAALQSKLRCVDPVDCRHITFCNFDGSLYFKKLTCDVLFSDNNNLVLRVLDCDHNSDCWVKNFER